MWHVLLTEPNRERTALRQLERLGCGPYLPLLATSTCQRVPHGRRWRISVRALFPGYLFLPTWAAERFFAFRELAIGIRQNSCPFLRTGAEPARIPTEKVTQIMQLEKELHVKRRRRLRFRTGDQVRLTYGPFSGLPATIYQLTDDERVTLLLDFLGRASTVRVAADQIEAAAA